MAGSVPIGTSGWHYQHWRGPFYDERLPATKMLDYYVKHFDAVEINNSFYRLPLERALESWRESTPHGFCFAYQGSYSPAVLEEWAARIQEWRRKLRAIKRLLA